MPRERKASVMMLAKMRGYYSNLSSRASKFVRTSFFVANSDQRVDDLLEKIFDLMDTTKNGCINNHEGARFGNALFGDNTQALSWWNDLMEHSDADGNGSLDLDEWTTYMNEEYLADMDSQTAYATVRFMYDQLSNSNLTVLHGHGVASFLESKVSKPVATNDLPWLKDKKKKKRPLNKNPMKTPTTQLWTGEGEP